MKGAGGYVSELGDDFGRAWNRFWFQPSDPSLVSALRIVAGLAAVAYLVSHTADLTTWFAADGLLPVETVRQLTGAAAEDGPTVFRWSYFYLIESPPLLWGAHALGLLVVTALTVGCYSRISCAASLVVVLSYVHRAPMITGPWEPVLTMILLYLCIGPCGARYSFDAWRRRRAAAGSAADERSAAATFSVRLMQVHLSAFYLLMGLTKLAGVTWWSGEAVWWLIARTEARLVDLTFLHEYFLLVNLWTYAIVVFELCFGLLIWNRWARPVLLVWSLVMWPLLALLTGLIGFAAMMLLANLCFLPPAAIPWALDPRPAAVKTAVAGG